MAGMNWIVRLQPAKSNMIDKATDDTKINAENTQEGVVLQNDGDKIKFSGVTLIEDLR